MDGSEHAGELAEKFLDEEYRRAWAEDFLDTSLALQITKLRTARNWNQTLLAKKAGTTQSAVSRMEDVEYGAHSIRVLKQFAAAFGLRLKVSFEEFGTLLAESAGFSEDGLNRNSFQEDPVIRDLLVAQGLALPAAEPVDGPPTPDPVVEPLDPREYATFDEEFEAVLSRPLADRLDPLKRWLMGYGLPHPDKPVYKELYFAIPPDEWHAERSQRLAEACAECLLPETFGELLSDRDDGDDAVTNLLRLCPMLTVGKKTITGACQKLLPWLNTEWQTLSPSAQQAVIALVIELGEFGEKLGREINGALAAAFDIMARREKGNGPFLERLSEQIIKAYSPSDTIKRELAMRRNEKLAVAQTHLSQAA